MPIQQGVNQQTPAAQNVWSSIGRGVRRAVKRGVKRVVRRAAKKAKRKLSAKGNKFVKGSAAAKRHMAKLRSMRKK